MGLALKGLALSSLVVCDTEKSTPNCFFIGLYSILSAFTVLKIKISIKENVSKSSVNVTKSGGEIRFGHIL